MNFQQSTILEEEQGFKLENNSIVKKIEEVAKFLEFLRKMEKESNSKETKNLKLFIESSIQETELVLAELKLISSNANDDMKKRRLNLC